MKRGISSSELAMYLNEIGVHETKASIDSKICRGTFSASFFYQCLYVIGCSKIEIEEPLFLIKNASESNINYKKTNV